MRKVKLYFFKESGKYYTEEEREFDSKLEVFQIIEEIENNEKAYKGMTIVGMFNKDDNKGFPFMIIAENRKKEGYGKW